VSIPEIFSYWLQAGRVDVGFLGAAQVDRWGNINTTVIGDYHRPMVRLPGAGGAPEIASHAGQTFIMLRQSTRSFVAQLDFKTSAGYIGDPQARSRAGARGMGPQAIITDLGILRPDPETGEFALAALYHGATVADARKATAWELKVFPTVEQIAPPDADELATLRDLQDRTEQAHKLPPRLPF